MDVSGVKSKAAARWQRLKDEHPSVQHLVNAYALLTRNNGNQYAGAITYFSFLALFPLLLLAVSITGFVLAAYPDLEADLFGRIAQEVPGDFGTTLSESIQAAIENRASIGVISIVGVLLTGLGWIGNLRQAIDAVWGRAQVKRNFVMQRVANLGVLAGLGVGILLSLGLTVVGTEATDQILEVVGFEDLPGAGVVVKILGIAIAVAADSIIFWWVLIRLPDVEVPRGIAIRGALFASAGFEVLKVVGTFTIARASAESDTAGPFASIIAILVWIQLVVRLMLFVCAWMAVAVDDRRANSVPVMPVLATDPPTDDHTDDGKPAVRPGTVGATLVGVGAVAGAAATLAATRAARRER